jgi:hypothetical protein
MSVASAFRNTDAPTDESQPCTPSAAALWQGNTKLVADRGQVVRFDLVADPEEKSPRPADDHPAVPLLLAHCRALDQAYASRPAVDAAVDAEVTAQLRALGYLEEDQAPSSEASSAKE